MPGLPSVFCEMHLTPHLRDSNDDKAQADGSGHLQDKSPLQKKPKTSPWRCSARNAKLKIVQAEIQQMIQTRLRKTEDIKNSMELSRTDKEKEIETSVHVVTMVINAIERNQALLFEEIEEKQEAAKRRAEDLLEELDRRSEIEKEKGVSCNSGDTKDPLHLLQIGHKTDWDLGVAKESINRKGSITVRPDNGYWAICRRKGESLRACAGPSVTLNLHEIPMKVGVFLDYEDGSVSFYNADAKTHIYTYKGCSFTEPLYPYFNPCLHDNGRNTAPLIICPVETGPTIETAGQ
ncbi:hypothetical protein CRENBAI_005394 [Crenichthys baileyi]|uniref:B30.2/SPRY domain-containing protein n=1 Tax=Crenichthys baileyi TaxID=28760 RepID=A0AAV9RUW0_9TELE